jgi:hypothetical protein
MYFLLSLSIGYSQTDKLSFHKNVAHALEVLSNPNTVDNIIRNNAYRTLLSNYCDLKADSSASIDLVFEVIQSQRDTFFQEYISFLRASSFFCFSEKEYDAVRNILRSYNLKVFDLDLIGIFRLHQFRGLLYQDTMENWQHEILKKMIAYHGSYNIQGPIAIYTTLASLGDTLVENKIINLLYLYLDYLATNKFESEKIRMSLYTEFYTNIMPASLGRIYTKSSLIKSLKMMENYQKRDLKNHYAHPFCYYYLDQYLLRRLDPKARHSLAMDYLMVFENQESLKDFILDIKNQAIQDKLHFSNLFDYWDKEDIPKGGE